MAKRHQLVLVLVGMYASMGAAYRTTNFVVEAPTSQIAERVGQWAEYYRKEKAIQWLGREMPPWPDPCPLHVQVTGGSGGGATSFDFQPGRIWQTMTIEGALDRLIASVLPHEVTHTVFAHYFGSPVPRWADEGGAVLSEDDLERGRHDMMVRQTLNAGRAFTLNRLFSLHDYPHDPRDIGTFYAEGYSISSYLVSLADRKTFLTFVGHGMHYGWDSAAQTVYRFQNVNELEAAWLEHLRKTKRQPQGQTQLARNDNAVQAESAKRVIVRLTAPPVQPLDDPPQPTYRGQAPDSGGWSDPPRQSSSRPGYLPSSYPGSPEGWQRQAPSASRERPAVRLGTPQFDSPAVAPVRRNPAAVSPVGYPD